MPEPRKDEKEREFINRCMSDKEAMNSFSDVKQRYAFCNSKWNENKKG